MSGARNEANEPGDKVITVGSQHYQKAAYSTPEEGALYVVRDKSGAERVVQVKATSNDGLMVDIVTVEEGAPSDRAIRLPVDSLARQATKGWCRRLLSIAESAGSTDAKKGSDSCDPEGGAPEIAMQLDSQNFGRCCGDIARANIRFSTQLIKDVGDGPFRAGDYEQAFLTFEQL